MSIKRFKVLLEEQHQLKRDYEFTFNTNNSLGSDCSPSDKRLENQKKDNYQSCLSEIRQLSDDLDIFYNFCTLDTFITTYDERLNEFLSEHLDATEKHFVDYQLRSLPSPEMDGLLRQYKFSTIDKIEFLKSKKKFLKRKQKLIVNEKNLENYLIIYLLNEIGVISFLHKQGYSDVKISKILSKITGAYDDGLRKKLGASNRLKNKSDYSEKQQKMLYEIDEFLHKEGLKQNINT